MAVINGSLTISATSTLNANGGVIKSGSATIISTSSLSPTSSVKYNGRVDIKASSSMSVFWLKMEAKSQMLIENSFILKTGKVTINSVSTLVADLIKAGKEFVRRAFISGEVITSKTLEGGGSLYMKLNQDVELTSGDYFELNVKVLDEEGKPKDISGSTFHWTLGKLTKTNGSGVEIVNNTNGEIMILLSTEDTSNIRGCFEHRLKMTDAQGHSTTILKGLFRIDK